MSKNKPNHHALPRFYLEGFCSSNPANHVWVFERNKLFKPALKPKQNKQLNPRPTGLKEAGLHSQGYGENEMFLQQQEQLADATIFKIRKLKQINKEEKEILANYIILTWGRLEEREQERQKIYETIIKKRFYLKEAQILAAFGNFETAQKLIKQHELLNSNAIRVEIIKKRELVVWKSDKTLKLILSRPWRFITPASGDYFVTTDEPVVWNESVGLFNSPLLFPLGRSVLLYISPDGSSDVTYEIATNDDTRKLNERVIMHARRQVYSPFPDEWIHKILQHTSR
jgi:hypothetical protein